MGSRKSEWEIHESSGGNSSNNGKISWMLRLGKKILVSGIVISSAPLVLPPLVAISAIGIVCSVPYGVFLVSYTCTQSVMSRLLPMPLPASPLLLEYRNELDGEEEADWDEKFGGENEVIKGCIDMEREEEELKEDTVGELEVRLELVDEEEEELDKENDEKKSMEEVGGIVEEKGYGEDDGGFLDEEEKRPSRSSEVEVKEITELKAEPASEGHGFEAFDEEDEKQSSRIKETPMEVENLEGDEEVVRETRELLGFGINRNEDNSQHSRDQNQSVENVDVKIEGTTKGNEEQSITESMNQQPGDDIHGSVTTTIKGDEKEGVNVNKETSSDMVKAVPVRESKGSSRRNRKNGRNRKVAEDKPAVEEKEKVDAEGKLLKANEGTSKWKQKQPLSKDNVGEQPANEASGVLDGVDRSEMNDNNREEMPPEETNRPVNLVQAIDVEENKRLMTGAGNQSEEIEVKIDGITEVKVGQCIQNESMSKQPIEEVSNIVIEFEEGEKNGSKIEKEIPFHMKTATVQLPQSTDIEEDKELERETKGLLEKFRDEGKAEDSKRSTEKEPVGVEKDDKKIVGDVGRAKRRGARSHDRGRKPTKKSEPKGEELRIDKKVQMKECGENVDVVSEEMKVVEGLSENMDVETVNDSNSMKELVVESAILGEGGQAESEYHNVEQNYIPNMERKEAVFFNEGERQLDEEQLDLLEDISTVSQQGSPSDVNTLEESQTSSSYSVYRESSDSSELPVSTKAEESDDIPISAGNAIDTTSNESSLYSEEKIWEQIEALRMIVGYKGARQETSIEELKALYLFTGIEPPASFEGTLDLAEVNAKLRFLMSVVGVK